MAGGKGGSFRSIMLFQSSLWIGGIAHVVLVGCWRVEYVDEKHPGIKNPALAGLFAPPVGLEPTTL